MKYIELIELEINDNKIEVGKVKLRKSFLEEYSELFFKNIIDIETNITTANVKSLVSMTYLKSRNEIKTYINKLRN